MVPDPLTCPGWWICIPDRNMHNHKEIVLLSIMDYIESLFVFLLFYFFFSDKVRAWLSDKLPFLQWSSKLGTKNCNPKTGHLTISLPPPGSFFIPIQWSPSLDSLKIQEPTDYCLSSGCGRLFLCYAWIRTDRPRSPGTIDKDPDAEPLFVAGKRARGRGA